MTIFSRPERGRQTKRQKKKNLNDHRSPPPPTHPDPTPAPHLINDRIRIGFITPNVLIHKHGSSIKSLLMQLFGEISLKSLGADDRINRSLFPSRLVYFQGDRNKEINKRITKREKS